MTNIKPRLKVILERHRGREKAITSRELVYSLDSNDRSVRLAIRELIAEGIPVASAVQPPLGYFIAQNFAEVQEYALSVRRRLVEDALRRRDFLRSARCLAGQGRLI